MGLGLTLAGLAAGLAGTGYSIASTESAKADATKKVNEQVAQQQAMQKKNSAVLGQNEKNSAPDAVKQQIGAGQNQAQQLYNQVNAVPLTQATGTGAATLGTKNNTVDSTNQAGYAQAIENPSAYMQGIGTQQLNQRIGNQLTNSQMGVTNYLSGLNASTLPYLLNASQLQGSQGQAIGSLLGSLGGLASKAGASYGGLSSIFGNPGNYSATQGVINQMGLGQNNFGTTGQL